MVRKEVPTEEEATWKMGLVCPASPWMESLPHGVEVPMPTRPELLIRMFSAIVPALLVRKAISEEITPPP
jgi:hypothetical protein